jgi:hypothetical protein
MFYKYKRYLFHNREQLEQNYDYFNRIEEKGMNSLITKSNKYTLSQNNIGKDILTQYIIKRQLSFYNSLYLRVK